MSSSILNPDELRERLANPEYITANSFTVARSLCDAYNNGITPYAFQDLLLRALEHRENFGSCQEIIEGLVREVGLFPYLDPDTLSVADQIAYEFHKPIAFGEDRIVFHRPQAYVYRALMNGQNVILSAPTSFGKSLIIDAIIASEKFRNILVVVPTIALIDETRRRLSALGEKYKIITHTSQQPTAKNIFIFTQERAIEYPGIEQVDFFVIDEFYKLDPERESDNDRVALLNQIFYKLVKAEKQFYMLGPSVIGIAEDVKQRIEVNFIHEPYSTVISELHRVTPGKAPMDTLVSLCQSIDGPTMLFCGSPKQASDVAKALIANGVGDRNPAMREAVEWLSREYHPDWHFTQALAHGIGIHHGRIPRALAQYVVRAFNTGRLQFLICTSTLIEGVNTRARNIIIFENKINRKKYDFFTFNNIRGRSGRMFQHFIGHVYLFHDPPPDDLPLIDIPALTQSDAATDSLLIQLDDHDLMDTSRDKLQEYRDQDIISYETLRANNGIHPQAQLDVAKEIVSRMEYYYPLLTWRSRPSEAQLKAVCKLIWDFFGGGGLGARSMKNHQQLAARIGTLQRNPPPTIAELIAYQVTVDKDPDQAVQMILDFLRLWVSFHFPRLLRALSRIQKDVFGRQGYQAGDYNLFARQVESWFLDPTLLALDEYGLPIQIARKIAPRLDPNGNLDDVLHRIKELDPSTLNLSSFEADILADVQRHI